MALRGIKPKKDTAPAQPEVETAAFWNASEQLNTGTSEYKRRLGDQISRLQERQMELVKHTAEELESLKRELESGEQFEEKVRASQQPLLDEIASLRAANASLEETLKIAEETYRSRYSQVHATVTTLKNAVRSQARSMDQQVRVFSLDTTQSLESMISSIEAAQLPTFEDAPRSGSHLIPVPPQSPALKEKESVQHEKFAAHEEKLKREVPSAPHAAHHAKPRRLVRRFAVRGIAVLLISGIGFGSWKAVGGLADYSDTGSVAGVSTDASAQALPALDDYSQSWTDVPFADTVWETSTDGDFGITYQYPANTSNRVRTIGGNNLWLLRKNHYLMNVRRDDATTLDAWLAANADSTADYDVTRGTFKGQPALIMISKLTDDTAGTQYVVARPAGGTLSVWVKKEDPTSDDGKRITKILAALSFTSAK